MSERAAVATAQRAVKLHDGSVWLFAPSESVPGHFDLVTLEGDHDVHGIPADTSDDAIRAFMIYADRRYEEGKGIGAMELRTALRRLLEVPSSFQMDQVANDLSELRNA